MKVKKTEAKKTEAKKTETKKQKIASQPPKSFNRLFLLAIIIITAVIYMKSLSNQFITTWDDHGYITENNDIKTLHGDSISYTLKKTFSSNILGNYQPLTMLSYCVEYSKYKLNPKPYHVTNLIFHIFNAILVFCFIWLLTRQQWVAFITALLFAVHPMHVESVSWVSERKDVLYAFFYLASLCMYIYYLKNEKWKWHFYALTFVLFVLGLLSKAMTVSVPITFFALDYFMSRKITSKSVLEKVPFILMSMIFGVIAIGAQKSANALEGIANHGFAERVLFSFYGVMTYLWKLAVPLNLSCFYNYPVKQNGAYPIVFYIAPLVVMGLVFLIYKSIRFGKDVAFGFGFFFITIALVLQILPVGDAIIADRYTYLPYIGIFFIIARWINNLWENKSEKYQFLRTISLAGIVVFTIICSYLTVKQSKTWYDSISLWGNAIEQFDAAPKSFNNRGLAYYQSKQYDKALADFNRTIQLEDTYPDIYYNRGVVNFDLKKYDEALKDYDSALKNNPKFAKAYNNRGNVYHLLGKYNEAINDYSSAINYNSTFGKAYCDRAGTYFTIQKFQTAMDDVLKAQQFGYYVDPRFIEAIQDGIKKTSQKPIN